MLPVDSADFVRAALMEGGHPELAELVYTNRGGYPCVRWDKLPAPPMQSDCAAVCKAFDLWYGGPQELFPGARWGGYSAQEVDEWYLHALDRWLTLNSDAA